MATHPVRRAFGVKAHHPVWGWLTPAVEGAGAVGGARWRLDQLPAPASAAPIAACTLPLEAASAKRARCFTRATLGAWGAEELADDVAVVASELVGNAVRHAGGRGPDPLACFGADSPIRLGLVDLGADVLCAVADSSREVPVVRAADDLAESGRGLHVVACLSARWGCTPPDRLGKVVWAAFTVPDAALGQERAASA